MEAFDQLIPEVRMLLDVAGISVPVTDAEIELTLRNASGVRLAEQIDDKIPAGATELERAKNADLIRSPVKIKTCDNCQHIHNGYCTDKRVDLNIASLSGSIEDYCCAFWERPEVQRVAHEFSQGAGAAFEPQVPVPDYRQDEDWDCGAAAMRSVCDYLGCQVTPDNEQEFIQELGTSPADGTSPAEMVAFAVKHDLRVHASGSMTVDDLRDCLNRSMPILCPIQSDGTPGEFEREESGHWIAVIGANEDTLLIQDPIAGRVYMSVAEFDNVWHDRDGQGQEFIRWGVALGK